MSKNTNVLAGSTANSQLIAGRNPASLISTKLQPWHWERQAIVYFPQSSPQQVVENRERRPGNMLWWIG